jgi:hypothetical protein
VLRWPDAETVVAALRRWAEGVAGEGSGVVRVGYFGSYARGDWGVGSDLDVVIVVDGTATPFERRATGWDATSLPVPADVLVYTADEWECLAEGSPMARAMRREARWVWQREEAPSP